MASTPGETRTADRPAKTAESVRTAAANAPLIAGAVIATLVVIWLVGLRQGALFVIGIGFGAVLAAVSFGFTTGWRVWIRERDPTGFLAQFLAIGLAMAASIPLIATHPELSGAIAPLSVSLVIGAFVFGAAMQVADGCGSGTLYKAGLGNAFSLAVLPGFIAGSFLGAVHLDRWLALGSLPPVSLPEHLGAGPALLVQTAAFAGIGWWLWSRRRRTDTRWQGRGIYIAAVVMAVFAVLNLIVAGQPWGIVYGLGLWGAKVATWFGADLTANAYWGRAAHVRGTARPTTRATARQWLAAVVTGFALGYSARLAFGCNVGAYFAGISTGSLHGWVWLAAAFAGSMLGVQLRDRLGLKS
jgi:uncharacterized membrane protein YedE/YeeE